MLKRKRQPRGRWVSCIASVILLFHEMSLGVLESCVSHLFHMPRRMEMASVSAYQIQQLTNHPRIMCTLLSTFTLYTIHRIYSHSQHKYLPACVHLP